MQQIPITYRQAAAMSERVYYPPGQRGKYYSNPSAVWPWVIPPSLNSRDWCVWVEHAIPGTDYKPKAVLAFRGTSLDGLGDLARLRLTSTGFAKTAADLRADGEILLGIFREGERFKTSLAVAQRVVARYGADNTTIVGHSLGGRIAIECALTTGAWCIAFAPGYSPFDPVRSGRGPRIRSLTSRNDIVAAAALADGGAHEVADASGHGIGQYDTLFTPVGSSFSPYRFEV